MAKITQHDAPSLNVNSGNSAVDDGLVTVSNFGDGEYYNLWDVPGWYADNITTNLQTSSNIEFKDKEVKYYGQVKGEETIGPGSRESLDIGVKGASNEERDGNLDEKEFSVQGIGNATMGHSGTANPNDDPEDDSYHFVTVTVSNNTSTTYTGNAGGVTVWDETAD